MNKQEFMNALEEILELDENTLQTEQRLSEIEAWDSLAFLSVIAMADEQFDLMLEGRKLEQVTKVQDLIDLVSTHFTEAA